MDEVKLTRYADVREAFESGDLRVPGVPAGGEVGSLRWLRSSVARFSSGDVHERRRSLALEELARLDVDWLRRTARGRTRAVLAAGGDAASAARSVPASVLATALGVAEGDLDGAVEAAVELVPAYLGGGDEARADRLVGQLMAVLPAAPEDVLANRISLLLQGCQSTAALALAGLSRMKPGLSVNAVLLEVLRRDAPVRMTRRLAVRETAIGGAPIPAGALVVLDLAAANRDPAAFDDPDGFDPGRRGPAHLTFGHGPRPCPGVEQALALAAGVVEGVGTAT
jgi:cytochrome P450